LGVRFVCISARREVTKAIEFPLESRYDTLLLLGCEGNVPEFVKADPYTANTALSRELTLRQPKLHSSLFEISNSSCRHAFSSLCSESLAGAKERWGTNKSTVF
jgi:hypothetical protein